MKKKYCRFYFKFLCNIHIVAKRDSVLRSLVKPKPKLYSKTSLNHKMIYFIRISGHHASAFLFSSLIDVSVLSAHYIHNSTDIETVRQEKTLAHRPERGNQGNTPKTLLTQRKKYKTEE